MGETVDTFGFERSELDDWLSRLNKKGKVYCPDDGDNPSSPSGWRIWEGGVFPEMKPGPGKCSIKTFYFPQPETLHIFSSAVDDPDAFLLKEAVEGEPRVNIVAGVRPCDAKSVYLNNLPYSFDPYFQAKISNTVLVGFSCVEKCSTCFCQDVGGSPFDTESLDIVVTQIGDRFIAEVLSDRGKAIVDRAEKDSPASDIEKTELEKLRSDAATDTIAAPEEKLKAKDLMVMYNASFWLTLSDSCLNCGACTFLCPTCYCFDIQDEVIGRNGRRIRYWDSCMFPLYTAHASGHNPRGQKIQRVRNRFMHKLKYFPDRFGPVSCVGCGRCVKECPVNIDIREVHKDLLLVE